MDVERINPSELARPSGFSHAVSVTAGRMVFLAGQVGMDRDGKVVSGGVVAQFEQALANLLTALAAAGGEPGDLVSLTIYIVDRSARPGVGWPAPSTRPQRAWRLPGCGTPRPWWSSRASRR
jgi:enamine deaminase RidA (YjgF/YER057c/UK114 family)